jgi:CRP-like cAMP-binding protein
VTAARTQAIPSVFLRPAAPGQRIKFARGQFIFRQGDVSDGIYLVVSGRVRLSVTDPMGRQATVALLGANEVFGEQCLLYGSRTRFMTAYATTATEVVKIRLEAVKAVLARDLGFANFLLQCFVSRMAQYEQALVHHIVNNAERRLARALLQVSKYDTAKSSPTPIEDISQGMLAEMVGASRPRINGFMTKFRRLGHIEYRGNRIIVNPSLLSVLFQAPGAGKREKRD